MMFDGMEAKWNFVRMFSRADCSVHRARLQTNVHGRTGIDCSARWLPADVLMNNFDLLMNLSCTCNTNNELEDEIGFEPTNDAPGRAEQAKQTVVDSTCFHSMTL